MDKRERPIVVSRVCQLRQKKYGDSQGKPLLFLLFFDIIIV